MSCQIDSRMVLVVALILALSACASAVGPAGVDAPLAIVETARPPAQAGPTGAPSPSPSPSANPTATRRPTPAPTETPVPTPTATATPAPALQQLTEGGCCTQPFWHPDSSHVLYIDRPGPNEPLGIWAVAIDDPFQPRLYTERIALYSDDLRYLVDSDGQTTIVERLPDTTAGDQGARWQVPAGGRPVSFSPGRTRIAWQVSNDALAVETRVTEIWVASLDGNDVRSVVSLPRGGLIGWISDDVLLLSGRESLSTAETVIWTYSISTDTSVEVVRSERVRGTALSPDGRWLIYYQTFGDLESNGLWAVRTDGSQHFALPTELFGAYQWRDSQRLFIIPFEPDAQVHTLWEYDVDERAARQLTDPGTTPFKVANGDWRVSPDGQRVVFVASDDLNLWLLTLSGF